MRVWLRIFGIVAGLLSIAFGVIVRGVLWHCENSCPSDLEGAAVVWGPLIGGALIAVWGVTSLARKER